jgi:hypothetical protein
MQTNVNDALPGSHRQHYRPLESLARGWRMVTDGDNSFNDSTGTFTRVVSRTFELDGISFSWWAIDDSPAFVTVSSQWFGSKAELTEGDPEAFARTLAEQILGEHRRRADSMRSLREKQMETSRNERGSKTRK